MQSDLHGERLRLALTLDRRVWFDTFLLDNPRRLVIDLPAFDWQAGPMTSVAGGVSGVRHGLAAPGTGRIVFDLGRPHAIRRAFTIPADPGRAPRLVIDLMPSTADAFAASARKGSGLHRRGPSDLLVALDPGHGGRDPGAVAGGLIEKDLVLTLARELADAIDASPGLRAVLTRDRDAYLPLSERIRIARESDADVMISLHADRVEQNGIDGVSIYSLGGADALGARAVRGRDRTSLIEDADLQGEDDELARLLVEVARRDTGPASENLAASVLNAARGRLPLLSRKPHRHGAFAVLKAADLPSVLIEIGFLNNAEDRMRFQSAAWRKALAETLIDGIKNWKAGRMPSTAAR